MTVLGLQAEHRRNPLAVDLVFGAEGEACLARQLQSDDVFNEVPHFLPCSLDDDDNKRNKTNKLN